MQVIILLLLLVALYAAFGVLAIKRQHSNPANTFLRNYYDPNLD